MDRYAAGSPAGGKTIRFLRIKAEGTGMNSFENAVNATYLIVRCGKQRYGIPLKKRCACHPGAENQKSAGVAGLCAWKNNS